MLFQYQLDPIPTQDITDWLFRNSQSHSDINSVLGLQGSNLESVNLEDENQRQAWIWLNYSELRDARLALHI